jgi:hypothetical protein
LQPDPIGSTLTVHSKARNLNPTNVKTTLNPPLALNSLLPPPSTKERPLSDTKREELTVYDSGHEGMKIKSKLAASNMNSHGKAMKVQDD